MFSKVYSWLVVLDAEPEPEPEPEDLRGVEG